MFTQSGKTIRALTLCGCAALALAWAAPALAQPAQGGQNVAFQIPAQSLASALSEYARQSGQQLLFSPDIVEGKFSSAVVGELDTLAALDQLLAGSGLTYSRTVAGAILIGDPARADLDSPTRLGAADRTAPSEAEAGEEIVVTGTRIRGVSSAPSPVYSFDREDFAQQGAGSIQDVMRAVPQNFTGGASEQATAVFSARNGATNNLGFGASVNLRGLGSESTLVLLSGRRLAAGGNGNFVDVSAIPLSAIERIDVVPDAASAIYGSDAVGGVVNFILRDNFQGAETQVRYGGVTEGSLRQFTFSQLVGAQWTSGSVLVNFDYGRNEPLLASERPFAIGLQNGVSYLSPSNERLGVLINGHQNLSPNVRVSALVHANVRDAENRIFQNSQQRQNNYEGTTDQFGGTLSLDWSLGDTWTLTLAQTEHRSSAVRVNMLGRTATLPATTTEAHARNEVSVTELEGEGALFETPGGLARLAIGAERREETLEARRVNVAGAPFAPLEREVTAGYAELFVPIFDEANAAPFARRLNVTLAGRYEDYSDVGEADTWKFGVLWSPTEGVDLRTTYGTSFRAPYLFQYDTSISGGVISTAFPLRLAYVINMPAPDLGPENATTLTVGFDVDQDLLGFALSATYFGIEYDDRILAARVASNLLTDPLLSTLVSIPPDPEILAAVQNAAFISNSSGTPISAVQATFDGRIRNQGRTEVSGVDLTLARTFDTGIGEFSVGANASYMLAFDTSALEGAPMVDILDTVYNPLDLRARAHVTWSLGGWSASAFVNYTDDYIDDQVLATPVDVSSWTTLDLGLGYRFADDTAFLSGVNIRLNAQNVLDEDPPRIIDRAPTFGNPGYDTENATPIGRLLVLTISKSW